MMMMVALIAATVAWAQPKALRQKAPTTEKVANAKRNVPQKQALSLKPGNKQPSAMPAKVEKAQLAQKASLRNKADKAVLKPSMDKARKQAPRRAANIIVDQPEGKLYNMVYSCSYYGYNWLMGLYNGETDASVGEVVEGTDGNLYIHNLVTELYTEDGYWVKAEKVEGDNYVIHEQPIYVDVYGDTYYVGHMVYDAAEQYMLKAANTDIGITWKNGVLRTEKAFNNANSIGHTIGVYYDDGEWTGAMNWNVTMTPQTDVAITELPAGAEPMEMVMKYADDNGELAAQKVQVAVSGNDMYLQFYPEIDSWIKGTINGNKVTFATGQYLGINEDYGYHMYFIACDTEYTKLLNQVTFDYDATVPNLSNSNATLLANAGKNNFYYIGLFEDPEIFKFIDKPGTPKPVAEDGMSFVNYSPQYGYGFMDFSADCFDAEGNYLDPDKLCYKVYIGDEVMTFNPSDYAELEEPLTEIPFTISGDNFYSYGNLYEFTFYQNITRKIGIQVIYHGGGESHASEITYYDVESNLATDSDVLSPYVEDAKANNKLADGEIALNLGAAAGTFKDMQESDMTYDVAMHVADAKLVGKQITAISIPFLDIEGASGLKVWLSKKLTLSADGKFTADITTQRAELKPGFNTVVLSEPYTITADGVYIGYTFSQTYVEKGWGETDFTGVVVTDYTTPGGFLIHTDKAYPEWASLFTVTGDLALEAIVNGTDAHAAAIDYMDDTYAKVGEPTKINALLLNYGHKGLQSVDYSYSVAGQTGKGTLTATPALDRVFGACAEFPIEIPAIAEKGDYTVTVTIDKVNGETNAIADATTTATIHALTNVPKKRPLMEEFTGTWCGYCPRGFVGLEKMAELYPEDFIALSYHFSNGGYEPMEITTSIPWNESVLGEFKGFPSACLDRIKEIDAYYGDTEDDFGIEQTWLDRCKEFAPADIEVAAEWADNGNDILVESKTTFAFRMENNPYVVGYALVADGLKGEGDNWAQANYYADGAYGYPKYMDTFSKGAGSVEGLVFNDVIIDNYAAQGVEKSLPGSVEADTAYPHQFKDFGYKYAVNTSKEPLIQDKGNVHVVAMLIDTRNGEVVNANKAKVTGLSAIKDADAPAGVAATSYYDLSGRKVLRPSNGMFIKSVLLKNGKTETRKAFVK